MSKYKVPLYKDDRVFVFSTYDNWKQANKAAKKRGTQMYRIDTFAAKDNYHKLLKRKWFERIMKPFLHKLNKRKK